MLPLSTRKTMVVQELYSPISFYSGLCAPSLTLQLSSLMTGYKSNTRQSSQFVEVCCIGLLSPNTQALCLCIAATFHVKKEGKIRKRYNQVHLTKYTIWESNKNTINITYKSQEVTPFPAGHHEAAMNRHKSMGNTIHKKHMIYKSTAL